MPHEGEQGGGVFGGDGGAGNDVHGGGAGEHGVGVDALEGGRQKAYGAELGGAAADPIPHGETGEPAVLDRDLVELGAIAGDGDEVLGGHEAGGFEGGGGFEHAVAGFDRAAGLGNDHDEGFGEFAGELAEHVIDAVGVGVVEERDGHFIRAGLAEGVVDQLGAEGGAADADDKELGELLSGGAEDFSGMDVGGEGADLGEGVVDGFGDFGAGGEFGGAQPVVTNHAALVGIGDGAGFERLHRGEGLLDGRFLLGEKGVREGNAAVVQGEAERRVVVGVLGETVPAHKGGRVFSRVGQGGKPCRQRAS